MSVELYDLAQRLRAVADGQPVPRARYAPVLAPIAPVAVTATPDPRGGLRVRAATGHAAATGQGRDALAALAAVGLTVGTEHRTLVVPDQPTVAALAALARETAPGATYAEQAAVVSWWDQRVDHPGSGAVVPVATACAARWAIGVAPEAERDVEQWCRWLTAGPADPGDPAVLLALAERVTAAADPLPGLGVMRDADVRSWDYHRQRVGQGWDWRWPDDRAEAALGLATRADAAELYDSLRLADPLQAVRARYSGTLMTGTITACPQRGPVRIESAQPVCRLRPDTEIEGWRGGPAEVPHPGDDRRVRLSGVLASVTVTAAQNLALQVSSPLVRRGALAEGDVVTLRPKAVDPQRQNRGRGNLRASYRTAGNWLARRRAPVPRRREVPLDVVVAAADDE